MSVWYGSEYDITHDTHAAFASEGEDIQTHQSELKQIQIVNSYKMYAEFVCEVNKTAEYFIRFQSILIFSFSLPFGEHTTEL